MKKTLFGVYDRRVNEYVLLVDRVNFEDFQRWFVSSFLNGVPSVFNQFPSDFDIFSIGLFDTEKGSLVQTDFPPALLLNVKELMEIFHVSPLVSNDE